SHSNAQPSGKQARGPTRAPPRAKHARKLSLLLTTKKHAPDREIGGVFVLSGEKIKTSQPRFTRQLLQAYI
ncbi:hypothetical protein, partial [Pseudomonas sp. 65/3-MNA-CIBAN-0223]|uniref:hypothetical protein n=1 Tax=Pseudomonas sp. 65/3-MNA-CIBAN-0223 TaxID=3140476 RepID=UPI003325006D